MARPRGFEPLTPRSVVWCSVQLSYGRSACPRRLDGHERKDPPEASRDTRPGHCFAPFAGPVQTHIRRVSTQRTRPGWSGLKQSPGPRRRVRRMLTPGNKGPLGWVAVCRGAATAFWRARTPGRKQRRAPAGVPRPPASRPYTRSRVRSGAPEALVAPGRQHAAVRRRGLARLVRPAWDTAMPHPPQANEHGNDERAMRDPRRPCCDDAARRRDPSRPMRQPSQASRHQAATPQPQHPGGRAG
jgi:hypothetical protein